MVGRRTRTALALLTLLATTSALSVGLAEPASAAVGVSRAEVSGDRLRIEGTAAPSRPITVDGTQMTTSSSSGTFRVERSGYTPPADCTVDVGDGSATPAQARLSGCTVLAAPAVSAVALSPTSVPGGSSSTATVTLTTAAPSGGAVVALASSDTSVAAVPASVTVPAGTTSRSVTVTTSTVTATATPQVSATYGGVTRTASLTVTPPPAPGSTTLESVVLSPSTVQTGTTQTSATLWFSALTPSGGATVALASSNTAIATVPASVTVPAHSSSGAFPVAIRSTAGTATISATYAGVTRSAVLTVTSTSLFRIITESPLPRARVGENYAGYIEACCGQGTPYRWSLVSGTVPDGLRFAGDSLRLSRTTGVTGVPTRVQTATFTVRARDGAGNTATKTFTLSVDPASPLIINNGTDRLPDGRVGVAYETGLFPAGGVPPYRWSHVAGTLPPGLSVQASPGRVLGTPSTAGSYSFTVRVDDSAGSSATGQFHLLVAP